MLASMSDAHREWHLNSGVPMGQPGCPQDACHPPDPEEDEPMRTIKCGHCKGRHETLEEVRQCAGLNQPVRVQEPNSMDGTALAFLNQEERSTTQQDKQRSVKARLAKAADALPGLHRARYAVDTGDGLKFYQVDKPTEGRWAGYTFVKAQASDETYPVKNWDARLAVLEAIAEDPEGAMLRYGREIGQCGHCGRTLTNEESRELGIGPICRGKVGF